MASSLLFSSISEFLKRKNHKIIIRINRFIKKWIRIAKLQKWVTLAWWRRSRALRGALFLSLSSEWGFGFFEGTNLVVDFFGLEEGVLVSIRFLFLMSTSCCFFAAIAVFWGERGGNTRKGENLRCTRVYAIVLRFSSNKKLSITLLKKITICSYEFFIFYHFFMM